jgi:steroid delta-isomerase-like uncharacterized protein
MDMTRTPVTHNDAVSIVERYIQEVISGTGPAMAEDLVKNEVMRQRLAALRSAFPDLRLSINQLFGDRDLVAVHATASGTHRGTFHGVPPTGRRWQASYTAILRVSDGRIDDFWDNWDLLSITEQLGAIRRVAGASA